MNQAMIDEYLTLLECSGCREISCENLFALQAAHLRKIPYSNLTILIGGEPDLSVEALFDRLISRKQGGYCFELNGLLGQLLRDLGYEVTEYFGRWHFGLPDEVAPQRHRILVVTCGGEKFIVDAGIASPAPVVPLKFVFDEEQYSSWRRYRLRRDPVYGNVVETLVDEAWKAFYSFGDTPAFARDFEYVNYFCSTHASSVFRKKFFAARQDDIQHISIENPSENEPFFQFVIRSAAGRKSIPVENSETLRQILHDEFGMTGLPETLPGQLAFYLKQGVL